MSSTDILLHFQISCTNQVKYKTTFFLFFKFLYKVVNVSIISIYIMNKIFWIKLSLSCVPWFPGDIWRSIFLQKGTHDKLNQIQYFFDLIYSYQAHPYVHIGYKFLNLRFCWQSWYLLKDERSLPKYYNCICIGFLITEPKGCLHKWI